MWSRRPSADLREREGGFTLIELMVGLAIGLLATLAVTHVLVNSESQKRSATSGSDAQINGALALSAIQRTLGPAGYGFSSLPAVIGCPLTAKFGGVAVANFPATLAPLTITDGASGAPDTIRVFASGKHSYSIPLRVVAPGYDPANPLANQSFAVSTIRGIDGGQVDASGNPVVPGDLVVAAISATQPCELFQVTSDPPSGGSPVVPRVDTAGWNANGYPTHAYTDGSYLINLGQPLDVTYSINASKALAATTLKLAANGTPSYDGPVELFPNIVQLQALYGKDTDGNGVIDTWDTTTPTTNAQWLQVLAVRIAVVARTAQYEKENVTFANPQWDVGTVGTSALSGVVTCGASKCVPIKVDDLTDWQHYRYRVYDSIVPLRNMLWNS